MKKKYPDWVCVDCAKKARKTKGEEFKQFEVSTIHYEKCDVCKKIKAVTEPRDFYYPDFNYIPKLKVIKKIVKTPCYCCSSVGGKPTSRNKCKVCNGTGKYKESHYYHIFGNQCIDGDTVK
jgi:hypothetical protein